MASTLLRESLRHYPKTYAVAAAAGAAAYGYAHDESLPGKALATLGLPVARAPMACTWPGAIGTVVNPLPQLQLPIPASLPAPSPFIVPNERHPARMHSIIQAAPAGAYVGVGGIARTMFPAILNEKLECVVAADYDPGIQLANQLDMALLRNASCLLHYRFLRRGDAWSWRWLSRQSDCPPEDRALLENPAHATWWRSIEPTLKRAIKSHRFPPSVLSLNIATEADGPGTLRVAALNYFAAAQGFKRVSTLARAGRVQVAAMDLTDAPSVLRVGSALGDTDVKLAVLDASNAWWHTFAGPEAVVAAGQALQAGAHPEALLLVSNLDCSYNWSYVGAHLRAAVDGQEARALVQFLERWTPTDVAPPTPMDPHFAKACNHGLAPARRVG